MSGMVGVEGGGWSAVLCTFECCKRLREWIRVVECVLSPEGTGWGQRQTGEHKTDNLVLYDLTPACVKNNRMHLADTCDAVHVYCKNVCTLQSLAALLGSASHYY